MEFYWRFSDIPEFRNLDKAQQTEIWAATTGRRFRDPFLLVSLLVAVVVMGLCFSLGNLFIPWSYGAAIGGGLGAGLGNFIGLGLAIPRSRPHIAAEIQARGW